MSTALGIDIGGSSIKACFVREGAAGQFARSDAYERPDAETIRARVAQAVESLGPAAGGAEHVGIAVPGILDGAGTRVTLSVNVPGLEGLNLQDLACPIAPCAATACVVTDATAGARGYWSRSPAPGRLLALVMGSGVGACVLDDGQPVTIDERSTGHIGQMDVGACGLGEAPIGPDGGRGSLEAFVGAPALVARFGEDIAAGLDDVRPEDPVLRALARAIRICHAVYRPHRVALLGGIGGCFGNRLSDLRTLIERDLTSVARPEWTIESGSDSHDGALGAALLAMHDKGVREARG